MKSPNLGLSETWPGWFWLPGREDVEQAGRLSYSPDVGVQLELDYRDGVERDGTSLLGADVGPVVHGRLNDGRDVTLLDCLVTNESTKSNSGRLTSIQTVYVHCALIGIHLESSHEPRFVRLDASIEGLVEWTGLTSILRTKGPHESVDIDGQRVEVLHVVQLRQGQELEARIPGGSLRVFVGASWERGGGRFSARDEAVVRLELDALATWNELDVLANRFRGLLSFCSWAPRPFTALRLVWLDDLQPKGTGDANGAERFVDVYREALVVPSAVPREFGFGDFMFAAKEVDFSHVVSQWFELTDRLESPINVLLAQIEHPETFVEVRCANSVIAAESLHRGLKTGLAPWPPVEFEKLRTAVLDSVRGRQKEWVAARLENKPSLRERLDELATRVDPGLRAKLHMDTANWATAASQARNGIAHDGAVKGGEGAALLAITRFAQAVVALVLLREIGVDSALVTRAVERHRFFREVQHLAQHLK